jgi:hypothetical protein
VKLGERRDEVEIARMGEELLSGSVCSIIDMA